MATSKDSAIKARRTRLLKKSNEELITIILKKDINESKLSSRIKSLLSRLSEYENKYKKIEIKCTNLQKALSNVNTQLNETTEQSYIYEHKVEERGNIIIKQEDIIKRYKYLSIILALIIFLMVFGYLFIC